MAIFRNLLGVKSFQFFQRIFFSFPFKICYSSLLLFLWHFIFSPFRFNRVEVSSELFENEPPGTVVKYLEARSTSSLMFEITDGNADDMFEVNPSTGIVVTKRPLDYENKSVYNLSITATNMVRFTIHTRLLYFHSPPLFHY